MKATNAAMLRDLSDKICRFYDLPYGTKIALWDKKKERLVRNNRVFDHYTISRRSINGWPAQSDTVMTFCRDFVKPFFVKDLDQLHLEIRVIGANKKEQRGNKVMSTVKAIDKQATADEIQRLKAVDAEVDKHSVAITKLIEKLTARSTYPDETVCRALLGTLIDHYGVDAFEEALGKL